MNEISIFQQTVLNDDGYIYIKPLCDLFKINYENQTRRISSDQILQRCSIKKSNKSIFGDQIPRIAVTKRGFIRWIQIINPQIVQVDLREKFENYQEQIFDFLYDRVERQEDLARVTFNRLLKLRKLYSRVGNEIQVCQRQLNEVLEAKYVQTGIPFKQKSIN